MFNKKLKALRKEFIELIVEGFTLQGNVNKAVDNFSRKVLNDLEAIERKNKMLMDYLELEIVGDADARKLVIRKIPKKKKK